MRRILPLLAITTIILLLAVSLPLIVPSHTLNVSAAAAPSEGSVATDNFTIYVNSLGFNDTSGKLTLNVNEGDTVIINFIWNGTVGLDTSHQLEVQGYGVVSAVIDQNSRVSVVKFTANKAGTFQIDCMIPCLGMDEMQNAWLGVKPVLENGSGATSGNTTASSTASSSTNSQSILATFQNLSLSLHDGGLLATTRLVDSSGNPVVGAPIQFSVQTDFGLMTLGSNATDSNGTAFFATSTLPEGWSAVSTSFAGTGNFKPSSTSVALNASALDQLQSDPASPYVNGKAGMIDLRLVGMPPLSGGVVAGVFLLVFFSVYATLAVVLMQVIGIGRKRRRTVLSNE